MNEIKVGRDLEQTCICVGLVLKIKSSEPNFSLASFSLEGEVLMTVTWCPNAFPNLIAICPSPPRPITPICFPGHSNRLLFFMAQYTVIPAPNKGAALSMGKLFGMCTQYLHKQQLLLQH